MASRRRRHGSSCLARGSSTSTRQLELDRARTEPRSIRAVLRLCAAAARICARQAPPTRPAVARCRAAAHPAASPRPHRDRQPGKGAARAATTWQQPDDASAAVALASASLCQKADTALVRPAHGTCIQITSGTTVTVAVARAWTFSRKTASGPTEGSLGSGMPVRICGCRMGGPLSVELALA